MPEYTLILMGAWMEIKGEEQVLKIAPWTRSDVIHRATLSVIDSPLFASGRLRFFLDINSNQFLEIHKGTRLPRSQDRFFGVLRSILKKGGTRLISLHSSNESSIRSLFSEYHTALHFTQNGQENFHDTLLSLPSLFYSSLLIVGADVSSFPEKYHFFKDTGLNIKSIRITDFPLTSSAVLSYLLAHLHVVNCNLK